MTTTAEANALLAEIKELAKTLPPLIPSTPIHGALRKQPRKSYKGMDTEEEDKKSSPIELTRQQRYYRKRGAELLLCHVCDKKVRRAHMAGHLKSLKHRLAVALLPSNTIPPSPAPI